MQNLGMLTLGQYINQLRKQKNETLHQVSMGTDIDSPMLSKIERGKRFPTLEQLKKISIYFKVSETDLKVKYTAGKILREYGDSETTYEAIQLVNEQLAPYSKKAKKK